MRGQRGRVALSPGEDAAGRVVGERHPGRPGPCSTPSNSLAIRMPRSGSCQVHRQVAELRRASRPAGAWSRCRWCRPRSSVRPAGGRTARARRRAPQTVTLVDGLNGVAGVNTIESPRICQLPATSGVTRGQRRPAVERRGERHRDRQAAVGAPGLPGAGVTDMTRNGPGRVTAPLLTGALGGVLRRCERVHADARGQRDRRAVTATITRVLGWLGARPRRTRLPSPRPACRVVLLAEEAPRAPAISH